MANATHIHVDHVGSLLRPMALRRERERLLGVHDADRNLGAHGNAELTAIDGGYVRDVVKLQEDAGLPVVTDGEFRRRQSRGALFRRFGGRSHGQAISNGDPSTVLVRVPVADRHLPGGDGSATGRS